MEVLERRKQANYAEYERLERERIILDEKTQASERLAGAVNNPFFYPYIDGKFYAQGKTLEEVFDNGMEAAYILSRHEPEFRTEYLRRVTEREHLSIQTAFFELHDETDPHVLLHVSRPPSNAHKLNYDTDRNFIMVRISEVMGDGIQIRTMSLDGNDELAIRSVLDMIGFSMPDDMTPEQLLDENFLVPYRIFREKPVDTAIRERYDAAMAMQYGGDEGDWYAGRRDTRIKDTMATIERYPQYIEKHVLVVEQIRARYGDRFRDTLEYEEAVRNFVAMIALQEKYEGAYGGDYDSAGESAVGEGISIGEGACPTGLSAELDAAASDSENLERRNWRWEPGFCRTENCPGHENLTEVGPCAVCRACQALYDDDKDPEAVWADIRRDEIKQQEAGASPDTATHIARPSRDASAPVQRFAKVGQNIHIGGADIVVEDVETGLRGTEDEIAAWLGEASFSALALQAS